MPTESPSVLRRLSPAFGVELGGVDFGRPVETVPIRSLYAALLEHQLLLFRGQAVPPATQVAIARGFGDSSLDFRVYAWVDYDEGLTQTSAILSEIYDALAEAGIEIPFPQRDLHLRSVSDEAGRALRGDRG